MRLEMDPADLQPLVEQVVATVLSELTPKLSRLENRLAFPMAEAAALLGVNSSTLRDARLRGEITGSKVGKKIVFTREELAAYLARQRIK